MIFIINITLLIAFNLLTAAFASSCCFLFNVGCLSSNRRVLLSGIGFDIVDRECFGIGGAFCFVTEVFLIGGTGGARPFVGVLGGGIEGRIEAGAFIGVPFCLLLSIRSQIEPKSLGKVSLMLS